MNKATLEDRIKALEAEYAQSLANANAIRGAIQDNQYWLTQLDPTPAPVVEKKKLAVIAKE